MRLDPWLKSSCRQPLEFANKFWNLHLIENRVARWVDELQAMKVSRVERRQEARDEKAWIAQLGEHATSFILPA